MPPDRDREALLDIAAAARRVLEFKEGFDYARFAVDPKTQSAILHQILIIGEAVKRLSGRFCDNHAGVPWSLYAKMRDKMIHRYDEVLLEEVWKSACKDIPSLLSYVEPLLPPREPS